ncbi:hypothetical protein C5D09_06320 [Rathayibacter sp. AY1C9]|uniref:hypothetical protein n=1 Tax=Rathayibacter sp. AY1C9 TaxID=2080541 RepID=UPI000CE8588C|nr:hypothetical protein [Rathayibacter sp. AY1C9]PPH46991.1 hypothetical protein C5D09_06320 [Rathayibacter sp. AY1C9]
MSTPDTIPAAIVLPLAGVLWTVVLWPAIPRRVREWLTPHRWVGSSSRYCVAHDRCRGRLRYYNPRGVRLCESVVHSSGRGIALPVYCELHHGHRGRHYSIDADRTWAR